ncbi:MAG: hypothetical protein [Caudoviricetes sp.]|nr:MAG: hypothetical protein [Caudoviricetes sp.]
MTTATKQGTHFITIWSVEMKRGKHYELYSFAFDEPWQNGYDKYRCHEYQAEVPDEYQVQTNPHTGDLWIYNENCDKFPACAEINNDMTVLTLDTLNEEGWSDGKNAVKCPITPLSKD